MRGVGIAFFTRNGCDVDDPPVILLQHGWHNGFACQKRPNEINVNNLAPLVGFQLPQFCIAAGDTSVVDQNFNSAVLCNRCRCCGHNRGFVGQFNNLGRHLAFAFFGEMGGGFRQFCPVHVPQADMPA